MKKADETNQSEHLVLNTCGCDTSDPSVEVPLSKDTIHPDPEFHFSFSTKVMVLATDQHQRDSLRHFCHYVNFAHGKLVRFAESRR